MSIRRYRPADLEDLLVLFYETVHTVAAAEYTAQQRDAWAPAAADRAQWAAQLAKHYTLVAEHAGKLVGFGSLADKGYIDYLFVHKDFQSQTFGFRLLQALVAEARRQGVAEVTAAVSKTALPFVLKLGATIVREETVNRNGVAINRFLVKKDL